MLACFRCEHCNNGDFDNDRLFVFLQLKARGSAYDNCTTRFRRIYSSDIRICRMDVIMFLQSRDIHHMSGMLMAHGMKKMVTHKAKVMQTPLTPPHIATPINHGNPRQKRQNNAMMQYPACASDGDSKKHIRKRQEAIITGNSPSKHPTSMAMRMSHQPPK